MFRNELYSATDTIHHPSSTRKSIIVRYIDLDALNGTPVQQNIFFVGWAYGPRGFFASATAIATAFDVIISFKYRTGGSLKRSLGLMNMILVLTGAMPSLARACFILLHKPCPHAGHSRVTLSRLPQQKLIDFQMTINPFRPLGIIQP